MPVTAMGTRMDDQRLIRLLHLASPSLPTGAFAYSQGLEWAVEAGWVTDGTQLHAWLVDLLTNGLARVDIPLLQRMMDACRDNSAADLIGWCDELLAFRETSELRLEERQRGRAMVALLEGLRVAMNADIREIAERCQLAGYAAAAVAWQIEPAAAATGYAWSWLENQVLAGIKIIPLGQTEGHRILLQLDPVVREAVVQGLLVEDNDIGGANPALAIASSRHETQYTRLYRS